MFWKKVKPLIKGSAYSEAPRRNPATVFSQFHKLTLAVHFPLVKISFSILAEVDVAEGELTVTSSLCAPVEQLFTLQVAARRVAKNELNINLPQSCPHLLKYNHPDIVIL